MFELIHFPNAEELADSAALDWLQALEAHPKDAVANPAPYLVALSGGRIAGRWFSSVAARARQRSDLLSVPHYFWSDERCVPPTDPESNFALAREHLLQPMQVPALRLHRIRGEDPPDQAAAQATDELGQLAPSNPAGQPVLDLVLLGMGEDGHVASLFPGEPEACVANPRAFRAVHSPKPPPRRVTMGYGVILAARAVWVLVSGDNKREALRVSLEGGKRTPLGRVIGGRTETRILVDFVLD